MGTVNDYIETVRSGGGCMRGAVDNFIFPFDSLTSKIHAVLFIRCRYASLAAAVAPDSKERAALVYTIRSSDGSLKTVEALCTSIHFAGTPALLIYHRDITEIRRAEEELRRQSRGEAILENLAHRIHLSLSPADVLSEGLQGAMKWLGFESGGAYRTDRDGTTLLLCADESLNPRIATALARQDAREGVTGMQSQVASNLAEQVGKIRAHTDLPVAVGFGISNPKQAKLVASSSDAVIVGSAVVNQIAQHGKSKDLVKRVIEFVEILAGAVKAI